MKKNITIFFSVVLAVVALTLISIAVVFVYHYNQAPQNLSKVSDNQIISILSKNSDAKDYMKNHPDFKIDQKIVLTKDSIVAGQNGSNFREVYQGLALQDNRYIRVNLINQAGDKGLIAVIDFQNNKAVHVYGLLLVGG